MTISRIPNYTDTGAETEYETQPSSNGTFRKGVNPVLSASDQARLIKTTGGTDPRVLHDNYASFRGQTLDNINRDRTRPSKVRNERI